MKHLLAFLLLCTTTAYGARVTDVKVSAIDDFGGDTSAVLMRCQTRAGMDYDAIIVSRDVMELKNSGEYEDITASATEEDGGIAVTFFIKRKVRYQGPLVVLGCGALSESKIASESELKDGYLYSAGDFYAAAERVRQAYLKKYYLDAKVTPSWKVVNGNDAEITFTVEEGSRQKIKDYLFEGAVSVDTDEIDEAIGNYPWWNPLGWFSDDPVSEEQLADCCRKAEEVYRNHGFLDVKVEKPTRREAGPEKIFMVFKVTEGTQYTIGSMTIVGVTKYATDDVYNKSELPELGAVAGQKDIDEAAHRIKVTVGSGDSGLADTVVTSQVMPGEGDTVDIVFQVTEGVPVVVNDVIIRGNDYTKDKVIRREISLGPGDRMLDDHAERSQKRLENLDYFTRVRYYLESADKGVNENGEEYRNLVYEVEEKNTGSFMVGVGASSIDSVYISAEVNQSNFDLFAPGKWFRGGGQKGRAYAQFGDRIQTYEASVTEPYFLDRMLELTTEVYRRGRWYDDYDIYRTGGGVSLSYPVKFWPTWSAFGRFGVSEHLEFINFDDVDDFYGTWKGETKDWLKYEQDEYDDAFELKTRFFWSRDTRNTFRYASDGSRSNVFLELVGGDNCYWKVGFDHRSYFETWHKYKHTLMVGLRAETIDAFSDEVPIYDRMFLGGPRTIRGIEYRHVSPFAKGKNGYDDIPFGGQTMWLVNCEYTIPVVKMLKFAVFTDLGAVGEDEWDFSTDNFAWTVGVGLRLDIPMFPIRLDFATPIEKPSCADKEVFSFMVGYDF